MFSVLLLHFFFLNLAHYGNYTCQSSVAPLTSLAIFLFPVSISFFFVCWRKLCISHFIQKLCETWSRWNLTWLFYMLLFLLLHILVAFWQVVEIERERELQRLSLIHAGVMTPEVLGRQDRNFPNFFFSTEKRWEAVHTVKGREGLMLSWLHRLPRVVYLWYKREDQQGYL